MNDEPTKSKARKLRRQMTCPEQLLWAQLRDRRFAKIKFRRQHHVGPYIADFVCYAKRLVIEVDGESHRDKIGYDQQRQRYIESEGFRVIRISNDDVIGNLEGVLIMIANNCGVEFD